MKAVVADVPLRLLDWRQRTGADRWDEMWEGVLHMPPMPSRQHQDLEWALETWLRVHWAQGRGNRVYHQINLALPGGWPNNYRIPDLLLLTPDRFHIDHDEYFEGAPLVVVEIRSPGDETYEKLTFYAELGVPEVWVIDRDTKAPEVHVLQGGQYQKMAADDQSWLTSSETGIRLRGDAHGSLTLELVDHPDSRQSLPAR